MKESEIRYYSHLNELAQKGGIVIFGCGADKNIPTGELRQAFSIEANVYNRSFDRISVNDAVSVYQETVERLSPETLIIHIGEADKAFFAEKPDEFDNRYRELIEYIKKTRRKSRIIIVSLKNYDHEPLLDEMNRHLRWLADSEQCEYGNIASESVWNPKATKNVMSFLEPMGFVHTLKHPMYDLVKIMFCYNNGLQYA